jgi:hypothetical protein
MTTDRTGTAAVAQRSQLHAPMRPLTDPLEGDRVCPAPTSWLREFQGRDPKLIERARQAVQIGRVGEG